MYTVHRKVEAEIEIVAKMIQIETEKTRKAQR